jgi:hypothetical protein
MRVKLRVMRLGSQARARRRQANQTARSKDRKAPPAHSNQRIGTGASSAALMSAGGAGSLGPARATTAVRVEVQTAGGLVGASNAEDGALLAGGGVTANTGGGLLACGELAANAGAGLVSVGAKTIGAGGLE